MEVLRLVKQFDARKLRWHCIQVVPILLLSVRLLNREVDLKESLLAILDFCERSVGILGGETKIFIVAGFNFRICDGLITNFHQPKSTLLMLVDAFLGGKWRGIYEHAHLESYRFLSYGDGSLLWR